MKHIHKRLPIQIQVYLVFALLLNLLHNAEILYLLCLRCADSTDREWRMQVDAHVKEHLATILRDEAVNRLDKLGKVILWLTAELVVI